ncbi:CpsD/CapB family tyrosine-protein kinase [Thomasclavelia sp.]|uniref:CpsD/CapB family tyrosine-protein kinase n=1 Tax=Thomasclavelia sp. TaxID=3025757 RepID=UPI0025F33F5C|nr:CpsD/CapB family tyrosine-protein kinase [Thomasclavelia sp.]
MLKSKKRNHEVQTFLITQPERKHTKIDFKEVYRHIRTSVEYSTVGQNVKAINVTSSIPGESKSTTSINLAMIFATKYEKVLLIDCDLRKSTIHRYLKLSNSRGLTNALMEYGEEKKISSKCFQFYEDESFVGKLSVLTSGVKVPNPTELIGSDIFKQFINDLKQLYDFIIIDCPPIMAVSDAIPIGNVVDGTVFVCSSTITNRKDAKASIEVLQKNNVNILGTILTQVEQDGAHNGYYHYY